MVKRDKFWSHGNNASDDRTVEACQTLECWASSIVAVFAGRAADFGHDPIPTLIATSEICAQYGERIESLGASTRDVYHILRAEQRGYFRTQLGQWNLCLKSG